MDARLSAKLKAGSQLPSEFAEEAAIYNQLLTKYADDKSDAVANIAFEQAIFTFQFLEEEEVANSLLLA